MKAFIGTAIHVNTVPGGITLPGKARSVQEKANDTNEINKRRERKQKSINDLIAPACVDRIIRRAESFFAKRLSANYLTTMLKSSTGGAAMKGYVQNIETMAVNNNDFRQVLYTAKNCQLVIMLCASIRTSPCTDTLGMNIT